MQGIDEAVNKNIEACEDLCELVRTSFGPNGMNKMVINHIDKLFVTSDAATIMSELEVQHPAAKLLVMASAQQQQELGDNTNLVLVFAGELLSKAKKLIRMGLKPTEIVEGYEQALQQALVYFEQTAIESKVDFHSFDDLVRIVKSSISTKQYGLENFLSKVVAEACLSIMPTDPINFNMDNVRVVKILGGNFYDTKVVNGLVFGTEPVTTVNKAENAKVAIYTCAIDIGQTETKGTVLIHDAKEMLDFSKGEENLIEKQLKEISATGVKVLVTNSTVGDMALHFANRLGLIIVRVMSKFDLRRLCKVVGAIPLGKLVAPTSRETGECSQVFVSEFGSDRCTVFSQNEAKKRVTSIVVRGSAMNYLDDIERAIDDGVSIVKALTQDERLIPGAGSSEIQVAMKLSRFSQSVTGLAQYSIKQFAEALEVVPRTLAENAGMDSTSIISKLYAAHESGATTSGVDVENEDVFDALSLPVLDSLLVKETALKLATETVITVLSIDQIVMCKPAGGPKARNPRAQDEE